MGNDTIISSTPILIVEQMATLKWNNRGVESILEYLVGHLLFPSAQFPQIFSVPQINPALAYFLLFYWGVLEYAWGAKKNIG